MIDKKKIEDKLKILKENVVTDFTTKVALALVCKNLEVLNLLVKKLGKFNISLVNEHLANIFYFDKISYKDIEWAFLNPRNPYQPEEKNPKAEVYNRINTTKQCIALLKKREALVSELKNPKVSKLTLACLEKSIKDIEDAVCYSVANHINEDCPLSMKKELEDFIKSLDENKANVDSELMDAFKEVVAENSPNSPCDRINKSFNKDMTDELSHDIDDLQNMVNEGAIQPDSDEDDAALSERVLPILHSDEETTEFKKVLHSNPNLKGLDIFDSSDEISEDLHKQAEEAPVKLYSSSVKDFFTILEDIDHWEDKDKE